MNGNAYVRQISGRIQRLYDRYDLLNEACCNLRWAMDALSEFRDGEKADEVATLEQIASGLDRDRLAAHAKIERLEAMEQARLSRDYENWT